jgi:hypothetical protein
MFERGIWRLSQMVYGSIGKIDAYSLLLLFETPYGIQAMELFPSACAYHCTWGYTTLKPHTFTFQTCPKLPRCFLLLLRVKARIS